MYCRFERCSGKSHLEVRLPGGKTLSVARLMRLLHIVGIVFAAFGISGALNLFNAKTMADIASAQQDRKTSNRVSFIFWPCIQTCTAASRNAVSVYTHVCFCCTSSHTILKCQFMCLKNTISLCHQNMLLTMQGFVALMGIYTAFALACTLLSWTKARGFGPGPSFLSRTVVSCIQQCDRQ